MEILIREFLTAESYKIVASFYRDIKNCGKIQRLYWFLDRELDPNFGNDQERVIFYLKNEMLLNFSYYKEKRIIDEFRKWHPRAKRKQN